MLEHVGGIDGVDGIGTKRKAVANIEPQVNSVERIAVNVDETVQIFWTATQVKVGGTTRVAGQNVPAKQIVGKRGLGDTPESEVFRALMQQSTPSFSPRAVRRL